MNSKKIAYLALWYPAGLMLGFLIASVYQLVVEVYFTQVDPLTYALCVYSVFCTLGLVLGAFCGPIAWRKIYVEGLRGQRYIEKK